MDAPAATDICLFEGFRLDPRGGALSRRDGRGVYMPVAIGSRALDILGVLVERPGQLFSRTEIIGAVWPGTAVEDSNLNVQIAALRRILDQDREGSSCIQTVPGRGYRFTALVSWGHASSAVPFVHQGSMTARPRLSVVVLPFANLSDDRDQQYFADGITDDLTTDLSRIANMFVISRNTAFTYKDKTVNAKQVGHELGVRYVLEGSVRRSGNQIRVNSQLIDAGNNAHLWAERYDRDTSDQFVQQDEITRRVAVALGSELVIAEAVRPTERPDALDYLFRGRAALLKPPSRQNYREAIDFFERALASDPRSVEIRSWLATALVGRMLDELIDSTDFIAHDRARAEELVRPALAAFPRSPSAHYAKGQLLRAQRRFDEAIAEYETVIALDRNYANAYSHLGRSKLLVGSIEEAIPLQEQAIRLSPRDHNLGNWYYRIGLVHLLQSRTDEAILWFEKARSANPELPYIHSHLASAYALKGDMEHGVGALTEAQRLNPDGRYESIALLRARFFSPSPTVAAWYESTYFAGLRKAGVPEE